MNCSSENTALDEVQRLELQADQFRAQGLLEDAARAFRELLAITPQHVKAERLVSSITGTTPALESRPGGVKPAPFAIVRDFLPAEIHASVFESLLRKRQEFVPAKTMDGSYGKHRRSLILPEGVSGIEAGIRHALFQRLLAQWGRAQIYMRVPAFEPSLSETHVLLYGDGDFFARHRDVGPHNTRRVTFVYNLHRRPKQFRGGDLLLYDTRFIFGDARSNPWMQPYAETYTRVIAEDNRLVMFPSEFYHEVTCVSGVGNDYSMARFAVNGWLHTTAAEGALDVISQTAY